MLASTGNFFADQDDFILRGNYIIFCELQVALLNSYIDLCSVKVNLGLSNSPTLPIRITVNLAQYQYATKA